MSSARSRLLASLPPLLEYPTADLPGQAARCRELMADVAPLLAEAADATFKLLESEPLWQLEELYTRTFDLNPVCTLEVGWHLYGEQYERGRFLVRTRDLLHQAGVDEQGELPDHLASLLRALGQLEPESAARLAAEALVPAVDKMLVGLAEKSNSYEPLLKVVRTLLADGVAAAGLEVMAPPRTAAGADDLVQIGRATADSVPPEVVS